MKKFFGKKKNNTGFNNFGEQINWKNMTHDAQVDPNKLWYGIIKIGEKSFIVEYQSKFRSEVQVIFEEEARLNHGKLEYIGTYK